MQGGRIKVLAAGVPYMLERVLFISIDHHFQQRAGLKKRIGDPCFFSSYPLDHVRLKAELFCVDPCDDACLTVFHMVQYNSPGVVQRWHEGVTGGISKWQYYEQVPQLMNKILVTIVSDPSSSLMNTR